MKIFVCDNILIKDRICAAYNFTPPYTATVVEKIRAAGMEITDSENEADAVLSTAAPENMYYIKPTYGTVSRFGLVAKASSMDQIGVAAHEIDTAFAVLSVIAGHDEKDGTTYPAKKYEYSPYEGDLTVGSHHDGGFSAEIYAIISASEFSGNISRFDGLKYGYRTENFSSMDEIVVNSRSETFTLETKLKALMGTYVLSEAQFEKYYSKATKLRRLIKQELGGIFLHADIIRVPDMILAYLSGLPAFMKPDGSCFIAQGGQEGVFYGI